MGLSYEKPWGNCGWLSTLESHLFWIMERGLSFGKISNVVMSHLVSCFSSLYALDSLKEWMINLWNQCNLSGWWTCSISRHLNDWEIKIVKCFAMNGGGKNKVIWLETKRYSFSMKYLHACLETCNLAPWLEVLKVSFFAWELSWNKVLTLDQFWKRE